MRLFALLCAIIVGLLALRDIDVVWRVTAPHPVTVAFAEGGDDAYYYFTVARNIAQGRGITIDGIHWTSGFQPLWGFLTAAFFLVPSEREAFGLIYLASMACWLGSALLLLRFVRRASVAPVDDFTAAAIVAFFLAERQLSSLYVNGMETALHGLSVLALLVAFQAYLQRPPQKDDRLAGVRLGLLCGLAMLARNDVVFLCGALLVPLLLDRRWRDTAITIAVASVLVLPWLAYCQWLLGSPIPQSGIATADSVHHNSQPIVTQFSIAIATIPIFFLKMQSVIEVHTLAFAITGCLAAVSLAAWALLPRRLAIGAPVVDHASQRCLLALAAFAVVVLTYYPLVSAAAWFYERYFAALKLLVLILLALLLARARQRAERPALLAGGVVVAALFSFATNLVHIGREIGVPWKSHMGQPALEVLNSPLSHDGSTLGMMESGRLGYLFPDRVTNLDGKMNVEALEALRTNRMVDYLKARKFDHILLYGYDVAFFDQRFPEWRTLYAPDDRLKSIQLFTRK